MGPSQIYFERHNLLVVIRKILRRERERVCARERERVAEHILYRYGTF